MEFQVHQVRPATINARGSGLSKYSQMFGAMLKLVASGGAVSVPKMGITEANKVNVGLTRLAAPAGFSVRYKCDNERHYFWLEAKGL